MKGSTRNGQKRLWIDGDAEETNAPSSSRKRQRPDQAERGDNEKNRQKLASTSKTRASASEDAEGDSQGQMSKRYKLKFSST